MTEEMHNRRFAIGALSGIAGVAALSRLAQAGPLNPPPGPIAPTGRTVQEIYDKIARSEMGLAEPRIPVQSLPGSATALHVISEPGSYYLTGNIQGVAGKNGIEITTNDVSLDLSAFLLRGAPGSLAGIAAPSGVNAVQVLRGIIRGWGSHGVALTGGEAHLIQEVTTRDNQGHGFTGYGILLARCVARDNRLEGFDIDGGIAMQCEALSNSGNGITMDQGTIAQCFAIGNGFAGLYSNGGTVIERSNAVQNNVGIRVASGCIVRECAALDNFDTGISLWDFCNQAIGNSVLGRSCGTEGRGIYVEDSGNNLVLANRVRAHVPYQIAPGNSHGPIVNVAGVGDITSVPNANHPWANFIY